MNLVADAGFKILILLFILHAMSAFINADNMLIPAAKRARNKKLVCILSMWLLAVATFGNSISTRIVKAREVKNCEMCVLAEEDE